MEAHAANEHQQFKQRDDAYRKKLGTSLQSNTGLQSTFDAY